MRRTWAVGVVVVTLSLAAGCSGGSYASHDGKSPREILTTAAMAMMRAGSVTITATLKAVAEVHAVPDRVAYLVFSTGQIQGTITDVGGTADMVSLPLSVPPPTDTGSAAYFRGDAKFYVSQGAAPSVARRMSGVWVIAAPTATAELSLATLSDLLLHPTGKLSIDPVEKIDGQAVIPVHESIAQESPASTIAADSGPPSTVEVVDTFWIAASGTPYPVAMRIATAALGPTALAFSQWNEGKAASAPQGARPVSDFTGRPGNTWFAPITGIHGTAQPDTTTSRVITEPQRRSQS